MFSRPERECGWSLWLHIRGLLFCVVRCWPGVKPGVLSVRVPDGRLWRMRHIFGGHVQTNLGGRGKGLSFSSRRPVAHLLFSGRGASDDPPIRVPCWHVWVGVRRVCVVFCVVSSC